MPVSSGRIIINPGAPNEETVSTSAPQYFIGSPPYWLLFQPDGNDLQYLTKVHTAGEPVQITSDAIVRFAYHNTGSSTVTISYNNNTMRLGAYSRSDGSYGGGNLIDETEGLPTQFLL
jgi:hypothetical protein